jgi:hypothetical protein
MNKYTVVVIDNETKEEHKTECDMLIINASIKENDGIIYAKELQTIGNYENLTRMNLLISAVIYNKFLASKKDLEVE